VAGETVTDFACDMVVTRDVKDDFFLLMSCIVTEK
jgi:hypothetical protein